MYSYSADKSEEISALPAEMPLAMSYVPFQQYGEVYPENTALEKATVFPDLYFPFKGMEADKND